MARISWKIMEVDQDIWWTWKKKREKRGLTGIVPSDERNMERWSWKRCRKLMSMRIADPDKTCADEPPVPVAQRNGVGMHRRRLRKERRVTLPWRSGRVRVLLELLEYDGGLLLSGVGLGQVKQRTVSLHCRLATLERLYRVVNVKRK